MQAATQHEARFRSIGQDTMDPLYDERGMIRFGGARTPGTPRTAQPWPEVSSA